jgi:hypothetical protein
MIALLFLIWGSQESQSGCDSGLFEAKVLAQIFQIDHFLIAICSMTAKTVRLLRKSDTHSQNVGLYPIMPSSSEEAIRSADGSLSVN